MADPLKISFFTGFALYESFKDAIQFFRCNACTCIFDLKA